MLTEIIKLEIKSNLNGMFKNTEDNNTEEIFKQSFCAKKL